MSSGDLAFRVAEHRAERGAPVTPPAIGALEAVLARLELAGVPASRDAGSFYPQGLGVLVGLPALAARGLANRTYTVPVRVISSDPLNSTLAVDALYLLADEVAWCLDADTYAPHEWFGGVNRDPLPSILIDATVTVGEG